MTPPTALFTARAATADDAATLTTLRAALFKELSQTPASVQWTEFEALTMASFGTALSGGLCHAWVAEGGAAGAIGSITLLLYPRLPSPHALKTAEGYLQSVYTRPEWRGRGVSTALVAAAIAKGKALGLARIRLHATADGQRIYVAAGFEARVDGMELRL